MEILFSFLNTTMQLENGRRMERERHTRREDRNMKKESVTEKGRQRQRLRKRNQIYNDRYQQTKLGQLAQENSSDRLFTFFEDGALMQCTCNVERQL